MRFDLTDLRLFLAVVDAGSITHGAADAGLSLPAASERLRDMELVGGVRLLDRGRRGVRPTEAGEALAHHARLIARQTALMRAELGDYARDLRSSVRVLANTAAMSELLPERLAGWMGAHPRVDLDLKERQSTEIARSVAAGFADIGVLAGSFPQHDLDLQPFADDQLVVAMAKSDPLADNVQLHLTDLAGRYFIGLADGALHDHIEAQAAVQGFRLRYRVRMRTFGAICQMAAAGVGIGVVPKAAGDRMQGQIPICLVPLADAWAGRRLSVCVRRDVALSAPAQSLWRYLVEPALAD